MLGLLFLIGPLSDLAGASLSAGRLAAIAATVAAFVALFLSLLPPVPAIAGRGSRGLLVALALLPVLAGATLALGAPSSFAALFVYFVAAAAMLLPTRGAAAVIAVTAVAVGAGLAADGADDSTVAAEAVHGYRRLAQDETLDGARTALSAAGIGVRVDGSVEQLPDEVEDVLAWAVREATTNVVRHSGASTCAISLATNEEAVALQVEDDGTSDPEVVRSGAGLTGLAERADRLHGTLETGARPGGGFRLRLRVPLVAT